MATTTGPAPNEPPRSRVLLVGDSTLTALVLLPETHVALEGFDAVIDAAACRRLVRTSCRSNITGTVPSTAVEAILATPGTLDMVVVKVGFNDWFSDFPAEFDAVVGAARSKGAHTMVWETYNTAGVARALARQAYAENNADLLALVSEAAYSDVFLADWAAYSSTRPDWFWDGTHLTLAGTWAQADYISRWIAAVERRPCPRPWLSGGPVHDPCPAPESVGPVPDPEGLHRP